MDIISYNRIAWNKQVESGNNVWTQPVSRETIEEARKGNWRINLTAGKPVPESWFPPLLGSKVLCLASGGGQQGPVLAAAGADVIVFDNSEKQLEQDRFVAERDDLAITTVQGDMADLSVFADETFDFIVHPVSNVFVENVRPVWQEAARVLKPGGVLLSGFVNPLLYLFDIDQEEKGIFEVKHAIPYSDLRNLTDEQLRVHLESNRALEFGHSLEDQIQGQIDAGFVITGFYEDTFGGSRPIDAFTPTFIATRAMKTNIL